MTKLNLPAQIWALKFLQRDHSFEGMIKRRNEMLSFGTNVCTPPPSPPQMLSYAEANQSCLNVLNSFSKPGPNFTVLFPSVISMKAHKHIRMEEHHIIILTILGCVRQLCILWKHCYVYILLSFLFKDHTSLGEAEETREKPKVLSTPGTCANHSLCKPFSESSCGGN